MCTEPLLQTFALSLGQRKWSIWYKHKKIACMFEWMSCEIRAQICENLFEFLGPRKKRERKWNNSLVLVIYINVCVFELKCVMVCWKTFRFKSTLSASQKIDFLAVLLVTTTPTVKSVELHVIHRIQIHLFPGQRMKNYASLCGGMRTSNRLAKCGMTIIIDKQTRP